MNEVEVYTHGTASCNQCEHQWVAVWPLGADDLECPRCESTDTEREEGAS